MVKPWNRMALLKNPVQEYAWGSRTFLPEFFNEPSAPEKPKAELWMGAHPKAPSEVFWGETWIPLPELIQQEPGAILGKGVAEKFFDQLPFLFKILAAAKPLSIQAHPDRKQAVEGYDRENSLGISLDAPHRNYRDQNHKPEIICALTSFWALTGFRSTEEIHHLVDSLGSPLLREASGVLSKDPHEEGLKRFFSSLMTMEPARQGEIITQAVTGAQELVHRDRVFEWMLKLNRQFPDDPGILSPLFLNLVCLEPGEAMMLSEGELHAYLEGAGIELMANSDNVLRGGLTVKHMDIPELLRVLRFSKTEVHILEPAWKSEQEGVYPTDAEEFVLSVIKPVDGFPFRSDRNRSVEIMICTDGSAKITDPNTDESISLGRGTSIMVPASVGHYEIRGQATLYRASVPIL